MRSKTRITNLVLTSPAALAKGKAVPRTNEGWECHDLHLTHREPTSAATSWTSSQIISTLSPGMTCILVSNMLAERIVMADHLLRSIQSVFRECESNSDIRSSKEKLRSVVAHEGCVTATCHRKLVP